MRGYYGIGVYHTKNETNIGTLWRHAALYGAQFVFTIGRRYKKQGSDTVKAWRSIPLLHYADFNDFNDHLPYGCQIVCIEMADKAAELPDAHHPERAAYLLGAEDHGIPHDILRGRQTIQIPCPTNRSMNVATAGTLVMYDRYLKSISPANALGRV